ncbi:MAG: hypothetical protein K8R23_09415 [Chthoniobacter sp.]|nr:hypothetical protein [Chthoniobacter sp.]
MKLLLTLALLTTAASAAQPSVTPSAAFEAIKKLEGDWRGPAMMKGMPPAHSVFRVTAAGSAVQEIIFPGTKMEMLSVYHMDKGNLLMTHYCALGNQPHMKFNAAKSTPTEFVFDFAGGTNLNPRHDRHMHSVHLIQEAQPKSKRGAQKIQFSGASWDGGKEQPGCTSTLTRRK